MTRHNRLLNNISPPCTSSSPSPRPSFVDSSSRHPPPPLSPRRFAAIQACEQQLLQFRGLSGSLSRWLQTAQDQLPSKEANLNTEGLQRRVQQLTVRLDPRTLHQ